MEDENEAENAEENAEKKANKEKESDNEENENQDELDALDEEDEEEVRLPLFSDAHMNMTLTLANYFLVHLVNHRRTTTSTHTLTTGRTMETTNTEGAVEEMTKDLYIRPNQFLSFFCKSNQTRVLSSLFDSFSGNDAIDLTWQGVAKSHNLLFFFL